MTTKEQKRKKKRIAKILISLLLTLIVGFVAGTVFTLFLLQNHTIVISNSRTGDVQITVDNEPVDVAPEETKTEESLPETPEEEIAENKKIIAIDAGHQQKGNFSKEPIAPGASQTKPKVAGGTTGVLTKIPEYKVTLEVALLLEQKLNERGYEVVMVRRTNDVNISNSQRAIMANEAGADAFVRIHCNGAESSSAKGALTMCQTSANQYCGDLYKQSRSLSEQIIDGLCQQTGAKNLGITETDSMSGINWCRVPVTIVEMGFMTNPEEDKLLCDPSYQEKLATGIANGIDSYFE